MTVSKTYFQFDCIYMGDTQTQENRANDFVKHAQMIFAEFQIDHTIKYVQSRRTIVIDVMTDNDTFDKAQESYGRFLNEYDKVL